ncbi:BTB/POZ and MATH domain-containing protein 2-like [Panicum miliaceum]|uniref:BTB/POZ and MATH domain-containing protein 2-like n=1 Tax=Panicum miliaceum TaxID=4540 RepID=A0A3L6QU18_PANMI|nr:BTB/POZ and MATH domain-containing protein 2-like [Panicum miliaceum]
MREAGAEPISIEDVQPAVFRELLHFIYTDSLPPLDHLKADDRTDLIRHLLVAADRKTVPNIITVIEEYKLVNGKTVTIEIAEP